MLLVQLCKLLQDPTQFSGLLDGQLTCREPAAAQAIHFLVAQFRPAMIRLQAVQLRQGGPDVGVVAVAHQGKEGVLLIRRVTRGGGREIREALLKPPPLGVGKGFPAGFFHDADHHAEERLDAAVAVAQQAERLIESVIGPGAQSNRHGASS